MVRGRSHATAACERKRVHHRPGPGLQVVLIKAPQHRLAVQHRRRGIPPARRRLPGHRVRRPRRRPGRPRNGLLAVLAGTRRRRLGSYRVAWYTTASTFAPSAVRGCRRWSTEIGKSARFSSSRPSAAGRAGMPAAAEPFPDADRMSRRVAFHSKWPHDQPTSKLPPGGRGGRRQKRRSPKKAIRVIARALESTVKFPLSIFPSRAAHT